LRSSVRPAAGSYDHRSSPAFRSADPTSEVVGAGPAGASP
jgi:hypothetical protein